MSNEKSGIMRMKHFGLLIGLAICLISAVGAEEENAEAEHELKINSPVTDILEAACKCENGYCEKNKKGKYECKCPPEWGKYYSYKCQKCNCGSGANCTFDVGWLSDTKECICKIGFEDVDGICKGTCKTNPCLNKGKCIPKENEIECQCVKPFTGEKCEKEAISTTTSSTAKISTTISTKTTTPTTIRTSKSTSPSSKTSTRKLISTTKNISTTVRPKMTTLTTINASKSISPSSKTSTRTLISTTANISTTIRPNMTTLTTINEPKSISPSSKTSTRTLISSTANISTTIRPKTTTSTTIHTSKSTSPSTRNPISTTVETNITDSELNITSNSTDGFVTWTDTINTTNDFDTTFFQNLTTVSDNSSSWIFTVEPDSNATTEEEFNETTIAIHTDGTTITTSVEASTTKKPIICKIMCKNGGTCIKKGNEERCLCPYPYGGETCTDSYWCSEGLGKELCGTNKCVFNFKSKIGRCSCNKDEFYNYDKRECQVIDKCPLMPGKCKGANEICKDSKCQCMENFKRNDKKQCVPNFCETSMNICGDNTKCEENPNDPERVKCICQENAVFNGKECIKVNKCDLPHILGCQQICNTSSESCDCYPGYKLQKDGKSCSATTENTTKCTKNCKPGICYILDKNETCICPRTHVYQDGVCKDLCTAKSVPAGLCPNEACESHPTLGFRCKCSAKFTYDKSLVTCRRKDMCSEGDGFKICSKKFQKCIEDFNSEDGFKCVCPDALEMDVDGACKSKCALKTNLDKCQEKMAICDMEGSEAVCKCPPLFAKNSEGICNELAKASYTGSLPFAKNKYDIVRLYAPGVKTPIPDYNKMRLDLRKSMQLLYGTNYKFADIWNCSDTASSLICSVEVQFNADPRDQVKMIGDSETCISDGSGNCFIPPELVLKKMDVKPDLFNPTDPCNEKLKFTNCGGQQTVCNKTQNDSTNFQCTCNKGFASYGIIFPVTDRNTFIHKCQDIDECLLPKACPNRTRCLNTYGSYECMCLKGYRPPNETDNPKAAGCVGICDSVSCGQGKCEVKDFSYTCKCKEGYSGANCDVKVTLGGSPKGMEAALITISTLVVPLILFAAFMVYKYRILYKKANGSTTYIDDNASLSLRPLTP